MAAVPPVSPKPVKPLSPLAKRMLAMIWKETEPRVDVLVAGLLTKAMAAYEDAKTKFETYLVTKDA
jgi:hypothetical protein